MFNFQNRFAGLYTWIKNFNNNIHTVFVLSFACIPVFSWYIIAGITNATFSGKLIITKDVIFKIVIAFIFFCALCYFMQRWLSLEEATYRICEPNNY